MYVLSGRIDICVLRVVYRSGIFERIHDTDSPDIIKKLVLSSADLAKWNEAKRITSGVAVNVQLHRE